MVFLIDGLPSTPSSARPSPPLRDPIPGRFLRLRPVDDAVAVRFSLGGVGRDVDRQQRRVLTLDGNVDPHQPRVLERLEVGQVAQRLEPELEQGFLRGDIGVRRAELGAAGSGGDQPLKSKGDPPALPGWQ